MGRHIPGKGDGTRENLNETNQDRFRSRNKWMWLGSRDQTMVMLEERLLLTKVSCLGDLIQLLEALVRDVAISTIKNAKSEWNFKVCI